MSRRQHNPDQHQGAPAGLMGVFERLEQLEQERPAARMRATFERLWAENPSPAGDDQLPAMEVTVAVRGLPPITGSVAPSPEGGLRLLARKDERSLDLVEHYFTYEDVVLVAVVRRVMPARGPSVGIV